MRDLAMQRIEVNENEAVCTPECAVKFSILLITTTHSWLHNLENFLIMITLLVMHLHCVQEVRVKNSGQIVSLDCLLYIYTKNTMSKFRTENKNEQ